MKGAKKATVRKARVFLVDDSDELRQSLRKLLESEPDFEISGEAATVESALDGIAGSNTDVVIVDIEMGPQSGLHVLQRFRTASKPIPFLVFSMHAESSYVDSAFQLGAQGYLMKSEAAKILPAIRQILDGKPYFPSRRGPKNLHSANQ